MAQERHGKGGGGEKCASSFDDLESLCSCLAIYDGDFLFELVSEDVLISYLLLLLLF